MNKEDQLEKAWLEYANAYISLEFESGLGYMDTPIGRAIYKVEQESRRKKYYPVFVAGYMAAHPNQTVSKRDLLGGPKLMAVKLMKYMMFFMLVPIIAQATMTAKVANSRSQKVRAEKNKEADKDFVDSLNRDIDTAVESGLCSIGELASEVTPSVVDREKARLIKLGYDVSNYKSDLTKSGFSLLSVKWCDDEK